MAAVHFSDSDFDELVLKSKMPVLVDFYAEWCGPCRLAAPIVEELAGEYEGKILVGKVDVDANQGTAGKLNVMSIPTVIMFKDGKEVGRQVGFGGKAGFEKLIKNVLD